MAENVVIDIDAKTKNFENALDELTAKVRSTASEMDKAFASGATKAIDGTNKAVLDLGVNLKNIGVIAAGEIIAKGFDDAIKKVKSFGNEVYNTTSRMQSLEMGMKSLVTSDLVKTGQVADYTEATQRAEAETKKLMDWFKELSLKSPYELMEVMEAFRSNANMGQSVATAKKTTEAILALGAGLGMGQAEMKRFSAALAQTGATGRITAMDLRQFANNGFGMDKMNAVFGILSEKYQIAIKDNNDFNHAVEQGLITTTDFFEALNTYALENYGGAVDAMASTIGGLKASLGDIRVNAINDLFLEASKTISQTLAPYVEYLMKLLTGGDFSKWGESINKWVSGILKPFQKLGEALQSGLMSSVLSELKGFFSGDNMNLGAVKVLLQDLGGTEFADKWIDRLMVIKGYFDMFLAHKDTIIGAIKGIGIALATAFAINKFTSLLDIIGKLNNPITKLALLGAAFGVAWSKNLFDIQGKTEKVIGYIKELINIYNTDGPNGGISGVFDKIKSTLLNKFSEIKTVILNKLSELKTAALNKFEEIKSSFPSKLSEIKTVILNKFEEIKPIILSKFEEIKSSLLNKFEEIKPIILNKFSEIKASVLNKFDEIKESIRQKFTDIFEGLKAEGFSGIFSKLFEGADGIIQSIGEKIKSILPEEVVSVIEKIAGVMQIVLQGIGGVAAGIASLAVIDGVLTAIAAIADAISVVVATITSLISLINPTVIVALLMTIGFAIIGQFTNFGKLIGNIFTTLKDNVVQVFSDIKATVSEKIGGLKETLEPFVAVFQAALKLVGIVAAAIGTAIAGAVMGIGTLVVGAINGIINGLDHIIGALISGIDFALSLIRLPFDIVINLMALIVGVIKGDGDLIQQSVSNIVNRLKHTWEALKGFWTELWGFFKDYLEGIWEVIVGVIDSVDISAGLERLFGKEVAQKFEEIRDKVLGYIEEIKNAWQHMLGLLNGDIVVMDNGQEISGKTHTAFEDKYADELLKMRNAHLGEQDYRDLFFEQNDENSPWYYANYDRDDYLKYASMSEETLFEEFTQGILTDVKDYLDEKDPTGQKSAETRRGLVDKYIADNYDFATEDPYLQSLLEDLYTQLNLNTVAVEANTEAADESAPANPSNTGKPESNAPLIEQTANVITELSETQLQLMKKATESLESEMKDVVVNNKTYNEEAIRSIGNLLTKNYSLDTLVSSSKSYLEAVGLSTETLNALTTALDSAENKEEVTLMLQDIVGLLTEGNENLQQELSLDTDGQKKAVDTVIEDAINGANTPVEEESILEKGWRKVKEWLGIDKEFEIKIPEVTFDANATNEYVEAITNLNKFMSDELPNVIDALKKDVEGGASTKMLEFSTKNMKLYMDNANAYSLEQYQYIMTKALETSGLSQDLQDAYIKAINTEGISKDLITTYIGVLVGAIENAGLIASGGNESGAGSGATSFKDKWKDYDYFTSAWESMYSDFISGNMYRISMETKGMDENQFKEYMDEKGFTEEKYYDSQKAYHEYMETLAPALQNAMNQIGLNSDTFSHVTVDNFAEAKDYISSFTDFDELYEKVMTGQIENTDTVSTMLEDILTNMADDETAKVLLDLLHVSNDPEWVKLFMGLLNGSIKDLEEVIGGTLKNIDGQTGGSSGGTKPPLTAEGGNATAKKFDELIDKYNDASGQAKEMYGMQLQAMLDSVLIDENDMDYWSLNAPEGHRLLLTDLMNGEQNNETYLYAKKAMERGLYSENIYDAMSESYKEDYFARILKQQEEQERVNAKYDEYGNPIEPGAEEKKGILGNGLLSALFGDDFTKENLSELFSMGLEGLGDFLTEDTIGAIQSLFGIELDAEKAQAWLDMSEALIKLGSAMQAMKEAIGEEGNTILRDTTLTLKRLAGIEISDDIVTGWNNFADALSNLAESLKSLTSALGPSGAPVPSSETGLIDPKMVPSDSDSGSGLAKQLEDLVNMKFGEDALTNWNNLAGALSMVAQSLMNINTYMDILNFSQLQGVQLPEGFLSGWSQLAGDLTVVAEKLEVVKGFMEELFGGQEGEGGASPMSGLINIGGGTSTNLTFNAGEGGMGEGMGNGLFGMLFGNMDAETIQAIAPVLTPELFNSFLTIATTQIDQQVIDSWAALSEYVGGVSRAIIDMMVTLTGGEDGMLGDKEAGAALADAMVNMGLAAEQIKEPISLLNPVIGLLGDNLSIILTSATKICDVWKNLWPPAVMIFALASGPAIAVTHQLSSAAAGAAANYSAMAAAIWAVIAALAALADAQGGGVKNENGGGSPNAGTGGGDHEPGTPEYAGGTSGFRYGTAIVGEHGPELVTNNGSRAWTVFSNNTLMDEIAHTKHALNLLSNSAELVAYNRLMGGVSNENSGNTDNSQNFTNNFNGNIIGDDAFRDMVEDTVREVWRKEMNLAN